MRFECDSCHAKYKISDEKVRGRVVRFPCRKCEHKILIDGRQNDADVTVPAGSAYSFDEVTRRSEPVSTFSAHEAATARARRPSAPARRRPPSVPPRRPSAASRRVSSVPAAAVASTAFAPQHPGLAPPVPAPVDGPPVAANEDLPEWHVSINDVPVGPIRLEEMGHKIDAGAVSEYSLVWREGFEEWRPLATVPALMSLLHERRHSGPPARSSFSSMPPFVETRTPRSEPSPASAAPLSRASAPSAPTSFAPSAPASVPSAATAIVAPPSSFPTGLDEASDDGIVPLADALQPEEGIGDPFNEMSQPPAPIGPEEVFGSSPQLGSFSGLPPTAEEQVSVPSVPPEPAAATAEPRRGLSLGVWVLFLAVAVFSGVIAFLAFDRFGDRLLEQWVGAEEPGRAPARAPQQVAVPNAVDPVDESAAEEADAVAAEPSEEATSSAEESGDEPAAEEVQDADSTEAESAVDEAAESEPEREAAKLVPPPDPSDSNPAMRPAPRSKPRARRRSRPEPVAAAPQDEVSSADQKILEEFSSGTNAAPAKIDVQKASSSQNKKPALDGDAVRSTVTANKPKLQRCYERAIRGQQSPPSVRLDITVRVASSGRVREVSSEGSGPGGLAECVEASIRRWRFPASAEGGPAKFPIVFSSN